MANNKLLFTFLVVAGLCVFAWVNNLPRSSRASVDPMDDYLLFGIDANSGDLIRFDFAADELTVVGPIMTKTDTILTGISGSAYIPKHTNIFGFWTDPADQHAKLVYINAINATASVVTDQTLGSGQVTGATAVLDAATGEYTVYAVQAADPVDFGITGGDVVPQETFSAKVKVLGAAISSGTEYDMPVTVSITVGDAVLQPFGAASLALGGNVNDGMNPRTYVPMSTYDYSTPISIQGTSWDLIAGEDGDQNSDWEVAMTIDSHSGSGQVLALRAGDSVPAIEGFLDKTSIEEFIADYVDTETHKVKLDPDQVIYLFELGTTDLSSSVADFQDLVVLVTLGRAPSDLLSEGDTDVFVTGSIGINPNQNPNSEFTMTKGDGETISIADLHEDSVVSEAGVFYEGVATNVRVKPKGPGTQNTLNINGVPYTISNSSAYEIEGTLLTVKLFNDSIEDGKAMGRWHLELNTTSSTVEDEASSAEVRLITVDETNGVADQVMVLERAYDSLAGGSGGQLYGTFGQVLYLIDPVAKTETVVGSTQYGDTTGMEMTDIGLMSFTSTANKLVELDTVDGQTSGTPRDLAVDDLSSFILIHQDDEPTLDASSYD